MPKWSRPNDTQEFTAKPLKDEAAIARDSKRRRASILGTAGLAVALGAASPIDEPPVKFRVEQAQTHPVRSEFASIERGDGAYALVTSFLHNLERDSIAKAAFEQAFPIEEAQSPAERMRSITEQLRLTIPDTGWEITLQGGDYLSFTPGSGLTLEGRDVGSIDLMDGEDRKIGYDPAIDPYRN